MGDFILGIILQYMVSASFSRFLWLLKGDEVDCEAAQCVIELMVLQLGNFLVMVGKELVS